MDAQKSSENKQPSPAKAKAPVQTFEFITLTDNQKIDGRDRYTVRKQAMKNNTNRRIKGAKYPSSEREDIEIDLEGLKILIKKSKTDQKGSGSHTKGILKSSVGPKYCPVFNYKQWINVSGINSGKIFRQIDRSNKILDKLSDKAVALILKWRAEKAGINSDKLAGHSMRSGIVTSLAKEGVNENEIKKITGHRSNQMVQRYIQDAELFDNATKKLDL